jgi:hypothetical protein
MLLRKVRQGGRSGIFTYTANIWECVAISITRTDQGGPMSRELGSVEFEFPGCAPGPLVSGRWGVAVPSRSNPSSSFFPASVTASSPTWFSTFLESCRENGRVIGSTKFRCLFDTQSNSDAGGNPLIKRQKFQFGVRDKRGPIQTARVLGYHRRRSSYC